MKKGLNFLMFQCGWFACVILGSSELHAYALVIVLALLAIHLYWAQDRTAELKLLLCAGLIGLFWENIVSLSQTAVYPHGQIPEHFAPLWIVAMWLLLAMTLNLSLSWLKNRLVLACLFGAVGGPLAFLAGERLGAVIFPDRTVAMIVLAAGWFFLFPFMMWLSNRHNGFAGASLGVSNPNTRGAGS